MTADQDRAAFLDEARAAGLVVELDGQEFALADRLAVMPLMRLAQAARAGVETDDMAGLAAMHDVLRACMVDDEEFARFDAHATATRMDADQLTGFLQQVVQVISARPTARPSVSSGGPATTNTTSRAASSSPAGSPSRVVVSLEDRGRPDLALMVEQAARSRASA